MAWIRLACGWLLAVLCVAAQSYAQEPCPSLTVPQIIQGSNIFTDEQETYLGDAQAAGMEQAISVIKDPELTAHLQAIVNLLARNLPPNQIQFRVELFEATGADAFSIAGGRIYISRKMVALTRSEDEMAGIMAHEMGHIVAHHVAINMSEAFRRVLSVQQVGDREDVTAKWNQFLNNYRRQHVSTNDYQKSISNEEREQTQADTIALYLVARAGYSTEAFTVVFDRIAETKGKTGSFWSDLFGTTKPDAKRLRQILKNKPAMPQLCIAARTDDVAEFNNWKKSVVEYSMAGLNRREALPGLLGKRVLTERLRPEVESINISRDGKYVLAQDDSSIFVLTRKPLQPLFRIEAPEAAPAQFTPDSRGIVFEIAPLGASPRVERWSIQEHKRAEVHEIYVRDGCLLGAVSPDGKTMVCLTNDSEGAVVRFNLDLFDTASGVSYWHKKGWVTLDNTMGRMTPYLMNLLIGIELGNQRVFEQFAHTAFSRDGHYVLVHSLQDSLCMDLSSRNPVVLPSNLKELLGHSFAFLEDERFIGVAGGNGEKSEVLEFPSGRAIYKGLMIGGSRISGVAHGDHVLLRPIRENPLGVFDLTQNKIVLASKRNAMDLWDDNYIAERLDGDLQVFELGTTKPIEHAQLPEAPLGTVRTAALSPDLAWLAISQASRGAVWNLQTGQRLYHVRGFRGSYFSPDGVMYADFPKHLTTERTVVRAELNAVDIRPGKAIDENEHTAQAGKYLLTLVPSKENGRLDQRVTFELRDVTNQQVLWTKYFEHERPGYYVDAPANSLVLRWQAGSQAVHALAKDDPAAASRLASFKSKDGIEFLQVFSLDTGKLRAQMAVDTGKNSFSIRDVIAASDRLVLADSQHRILVYSLAGEQKGAIAGHHPEVSVESDLMTVRTERGQLELYDLATLQQRAVYDFSMPVVFNGFSGDGKRLLVLTSDQAVYTFDLTQTKATGLSGTNKAADDH